MKKIAPLEIAENSWDNVGVLVGTRPAHVDACTLPKTNKELFRTPVSSEASKQGFFDY